MPGNPFKIGDVVRFVGKGEVESWPVVGEIRVVGKVTDTLVMVRGEGNVSAWHHSNWCLVKTAPSFVGDPDAW